MHPSEITMTVTCSPHRIEISSWRWDPNERDDRSRAADLKRAQFVTRAEAQAFVDLLPKSCKVRASTISCASGYYGYVTFHVGLTKTGTTGERNETGIKRYRTLRRALDALGVNVEFVTRFQNALTEDECELLLAGEIAFGPYGGSAEDVLAMRAAREQRLADDATALRNANAAAELDAETARLELLELERARVWSDEDEPERNLDGDDATRTVEHVELPAGSTLTCACDACEELAEAADAHAADCAAERANEAALSYGPTAAMLDDAERELELEAHDVGLAYMREQRERADELESYRADVAQIRASMRAMMTLRNPRGAELKRRLRAAESALERAERRLA